MHTVAVLMSPGMPVFEAAVVCEVFGIDRSDLGVPWYRLRLCSADPRPLRLPHGFAVTPDAGLRALASATTVIVPAVGDITEEPAAEVLNALRRARVRGARIASICSGAFVLAAAGLLDGRRATTHWMYADDLAARFPRVQVDPSVLYTDDDNLLTSAGTAAGLDLCLHLVRRDHGSAVANAMARRLVIAPHRDGGQAQFVATPMRAPTASAPSVAQVMEWALRRIDRPLTVAQFARVARTSPRTFARHFRAETGTTPLQWLLEQRLRRAQDLLESTDLSVDQVAARTGFGNATGMRARFSGELGISPSAYRRVFAGPG